MAELALGMKLPDAVNTLAGGGISVAFDPESNGAVAVLRSGDPEKFGALTEKLIKFTQEQREKNNQPEIPASEYRGVRVFRIDNAVVAVLGDAVVLSSEKELGKWVVDAIMDRPDETFATTDAYRRASEAGDRAATALPPPLPRLHYSLLVFPPVGFAAGQPCAPSAAFALACVAADPPPPSLVVPVPPLPRVRTPALPSARSIRQGRLSR